MRSGLSNFIEFGYRKLSIKDVENDDYEEDAGSNIKIYHIEINID
jgi:hypothetical protein